jgi:uncharacterized membrane protein
VTEPLRIGAVLLLTVGAVLLLAGLGLALVGLMWAEVVVSRLPAGVVDVDAVGGALVAAGLAGVIIGLAQAVGGQRAWRGRADALSALVAMTAAGLGVALLASAVAAVVETLRGGVLVLAVLAAGLAALGVAELGAALLLAAARRRSRPSGIGSDPLR